MDKLDEWMNREEIKPSSSSQKKSKPFHKKQKPVSYKKHTPRPNQRPGQNSKPQPNQRPRQNTKANSRPTPRPKPQSKPTQIPKGKLKVIPLGGLNEVGKNLTVLEYEDDIIIIDMGFEFPGEDMLGIDYIIPDVTYLEENRKRIRGVVITHGHLDHTGGIPYILPKLDFPPIYGTKLTIGLIKKRVEEFKQEKETVLHTIDPDKPLRIGKFLINPIRVSHSIPDAVALDIQTPVGKVIFTGDFKFDDTPPRNQKKPDYHKLKRLKQDNVLALFCESTNALKKGQSMSEREVAAVMDGIVRYAKGRLIVASFSSQIGRIQQIIDAAAKYNKKIFVSGRSMIENIAIASNLGYLDQKKAHIQDIKKYKDVPDSETLILTTGSQGEAVSALTRMANKDHPHVKVKKGDTIVLSSSPIIGNERAIFSVINNLSILGANVIHQEMMDVHTSGHAKQEELKRMINLVHPRYLIPVHGEFYMRQALAALAKHHCGIPESRIIMLKNGDVLLADKGSVIKSKETVETKYILIDGRGEGHI